MIKTFEAHAREFFDMAIAGGFLSSDQNAKNFVGLFMFIGIKDGQALFKHINIRAYIKIDTLLLKELKPA